MIDKGKKRRGDGGLLQGTCIARSQIPAALRACCSPMKITFVHLHKLTDG